MLVRTCLFFPQPFGILQFAFRVRVFVTMSAASRAFRCVQGWLLEKPAGWVDRDAPDLVAAAMVQQPRSKRPREDALLQAERSHQDSLLEDRNRLEERLEEAEEELWETKDDLGALRSGVNEVCGAVSESQPNSRAHRFPMSFLWVSYGFPIRFL